MSTENSHLSAVRSMFRDRDRRASDRAAAAHAAQTATPGPLHAVTSAGAGGMVELLWNERRVETYDLTHRIAVPLAGHPLTPSSARHVGRTLSAWWLGQPGALSNGTEITFVDVEVVDAPLTPPEVVLTLTTAATASEAQVANLRTIRDLRRALREVRRGGGLTTEGLAVVA